MNEYFKTNCSLWNCWTKLHEKSRFYDVESFKTGRNSLMPIEIEEVGDVNGRSLLHLQCHFGLDTLSWARMGAVVTGVDFSDEAIKLARSLSNELEISAKFILSNIYDLPDKLNEKFDIVFTSYGVLTWLPDLKNWAELIVKYMKPTGIFYIVEFHPVGCMTDEDGNGFAYPYFHNPEPEKYTSTGSYAESNAGHINEQYEWSHGIGEIVTALTSVGLKLDFLHEFPYSNSKYEPYTLEIKPGRYVINGQKHPLPLMFSIRARG